jgi:site-specific DNA recombinase
VVSKVVSHPGLVTESDFVVVQQVRAARATGAGRKRRYLLRGLLRCGHCGRRMDAHWAHGRAGYRCRRGHRSARSRSADALDNTYIREDKVLGRLSAQVALNDGSADCVSPQSVVEFLRSNAMVVEVYSAASWRPAGLSPAAIDLQRLLAPKY